MNREPSTALAIMAIGTIALYSTGHWIGGTVALAIWALAALCP